MSIGPLPPTADGAGGRCNWVFACLMLVTFICPRPPTTDEQEADVAGANGNLLRVPDLDPGVSCIAVARASAPAARRGLASLCTGGDDGAAARLAGGHGNLNETKSWEQIEKF